MSLIFHLLKLKVLFLVRTLKSIGIIRLILLVGLSVYAIAFLLNQWQKDPVPWTVSVIFLVSILQLHVSRNDKAFINSVVGKIPVYWIVEYSFWFLPFFFLLASNWFLLQIITVLSGIFLLPFFGFSFSLSQTFQTVSLPFPDHQFEWKSGFRRAGIMFLILYLLAIIFSGIIFVIPAVLFLQLILVSTFYNDCESVQLVRVISEKPRHFIFWKTLKSIQTFWILNFPLLLLFLIRHSEFWSIGLGLFAWITYLIFISVIAKYAIFREKENISNLHSFLVLFTSLAPLNILLFPIPIGMTVVLWKKSIRNLKDILHA